MTKNILIWLLATLFVANVPVAQAQQSTKLPRIGLLRPNRADDAEAQRLIAAFRQGIRELGYVEGQNIMLEIRWAEGKRERLGELAAELVRLKVDVIVTGAQTATEAAKKVAGTIPIIMTQAADPVRDGFVASLAHPGGNITGLSTMGSELLGKRVELLSETVPRAKRMAILWNSANPGQQLNFKEVEATAAALKLMLHSLPVKNPDEFDNAFAAAAKGRVEALLVSADALLNSHRSRIVELVVKARLPAMYTEPESMSDGGLMYYGSDNADMYRRAATYVDKILKGAKAADIPVERPIKFEFIVSLKAAKQIGLTIPPNVLVRASRVIR